MCLPRIGRILEIDGVDAVIDGPDGARSTISLICEPTAVVGDHVMVHAGYAIQLLDTSAAAERQELIAAVRGGTGSSATDPIAESPDGADETSRNRP